MYEQPDRGMLKTAACCTEINPKRQRDKVRVVCALLKKVSDNVQKKTQTETKNM